MLIGQSENTLFHDPIEDLPEMADVFAAVEPEIEAALEGKARGLGYCHLHWRVKKRILRDNHGVDWLSPSDMNPSKAFD